MATTKKTKEKTTSKKPAAKKSAKATKASKKPELKTQEASEASDKPAKKKPSSPAVKRAPLMEKTFFAKPGEVTPKWRLVDAEGLVLGRLATYIATALMGKDKPTYTRSADTGDFIVVVNAEKVALTGNKWNDKVYQHHTNYPGGLKTATAQFVRESKPERLVEKAVWRMLPKGHMGRHWFSKLKVYAGATHPHMAQNPEPVKFAQKHS